jgi:hypothetical protein
MIWISTHMTDVWAVGRTAPHFISSDYVVQKSTSSSAVMIMSPVAAMFLCVHELAFLEPSVDKSNTC